MKKRRLLRFVFTLFTLFSIYNGYSIRYASITDSTQEIWFGDKYSYFLEDTSRELTINDVLNRTDFQPVPHDLINENVNSVYWLKFTIQDNRISDKSMRIELFDFDIDEMSIYFPTPSGTYSETKAGFSEHFGKREIMHKNMSFLLPSLRFTDKAVIYIKFKSGHHNVLKPVLRSYDRIIDYGLTEYILFGIFYGLLILMIFYNLLYFFMLKRLHYLYYVLFALSVLFYLMDKNGTGFQYIWFAFPELNRFVGSISLASGVIFMLLFTIHFLKLAELDKKLAFILKAAIIVRLLILPFEFWDPQNYLWMLLDVLFVQFVFFSGIKSWMKKVNGANWFLAAFSILNLAFVVTGLENLGWISSGVHTVYALNVGIILQFICLSISIAESVKATYKEKNEVQAKLIEQYVKNEEIEEKARKELENKVHERTAELRHQKELVEQKNVQIIDSVRYAETIQSAILPTKNRLEEVIGKHFVYYKPRDIVSGDFYWLAPVNEDEYLLAVVDCTGHGVPGAFMSMIGINLLNRIVAEKIYQPGEMLSFLNKRIQEVLKQNETGNADGMDMTLCLVNKKTKKIKFSCAKNSLIYVQDGAVNRIRGSKNAIGGIDYIENVSFDEFELSYQESPIRFYLFTDGYIDQFGGPQDKKIMTSGLKKVIQDTQVLPMEQQGKEFEKYIMEWMNQSSECFQIDDITIMGVEVK